MRRYLGMGVALALAAMATASASAEEPLHLRIGWSVIPGQLTAVLFEKTTILRHYGQSYVVEPVHFRGSAPQITALATGDLDIAALAFSSFALAVQNAHMEDVRVIGDLFQDGIGDYYTGEYVVRADSDIHRVEDLKGKVVATNGVGGAADIAMRKMLRDHGLEEKRDYQVVEVQIPNMLSALGEKRIDLATLGTPYSFIARQQGGTRTLFTLKEAMGETQLTMMAARAPFIAAHRAALVDFFEDAQRALHWFADPANREEVIGILARFTKEPPSAFTPWLFTKDDYYRDLDARPNLKALQANFDLQQKMGFIKISLDAKKFADLSLIEEAARRPR